MFINDLKLFENTIREELPVVALNNYAKFPWEYCGNFPQLCKNVLQNVPLLLHNYQLISCIFSIFALLKKALAQVFHISHLISGYNFLFAVVLLTMLRFMMVTPIKRRRLGRTAASTQTRYRKQALFFKVHLSNPFEI